MRHTIHIMTFLLLFSCSSETIIDKKNSGTPVNEIIKKEIPKEDRDADSADYKVLRLKKTYKFEDYKVPIFEGTLAEPNFLGNPFANDKEYVDFIKTGCKENKINFAGYYTIIERSCGAMCSHIFIVDRKNGKIFIDTKPNDERYGYEYRKDSKLLIANSSVFIDDKFSFSGKILKALMILTITMIPVLAVKQDRTNIMYFMLTF